MEFHNPHRIFCILVHAPTNIPPALYTTRCDIILQLSILLMSSVYLCEVHMTEPFRPCAENGIAIEQHSNEILPNPIRKS